MGSPYGQWRCAGRGSMSLRKQLGFWIAALAALIAFLWLFSGILLPFLAGLVLAYFLDPVADALERMGLPRLAATLIILVLAVFGLVLAVVLIAPVLGDQIGKLAGSLPEYAARLVSRFNDLAPDWLKQVIAQSGTRGSASAAEIAKSAGGWIAALLASLW